MNELVNFDNWEVDEDSPFGSGASEKKWLNNPETKQKGIFKFPKGIDNVVLLIQKMQRVF